MPALRVVTRAGRLRGTSPSVGPSRHGLLGQGGSAGQRLSESRGVVSVHPATFTKVLEPRKLTLEASLHPRRMPCPALCSMREPVMKAVAGGVNNRMAELTEKEPTR